MERMYELHVMVRKPVDLVSKELEFMSWGARQTGREWQRERSRVYAGFGRSHNFRKSSRKAINADTRHPMAGYFDIFTPVGLLANIFCGGRAGKSLVLYSSPINNPCH